MSEQKQIPTGGLELWKRIEDHEQRLKFVEEALNNFWFDQYERMSVWHRRLAEKMEKRLSEIETLTIASQQENHGLTLRIRELEGNPTLKSTPCKHTGQHIKSEVKSCVDCGEVIGHSTPHPGMVEVPRDVAENWRKEVGRCGAIRWNAEDELYIAIQKALSPTKESEK